MPLSRSRDYLSIGEVLDAIREDFPDVSISKLRFLESEGLISLKRTDSGYRKFYRDDVDRLRHILKLQKEHFLPLKVIKEKLAEVDSNGGAVDRDQYSGDRSIDEPPRAAPRHEYREPRQAQAVAPGQSPPPSSVMSREPSDVQLSRSELAAAAGLSNGEMGELEDFGILGNGDRYDGKDLLLARAAKGLLDRGLEARHLRMYKNFADREAALFEQMIMPVAMRRDPNGRRQAFHSAAELATLSRRLREALLSTLLRKLL